MKTTSKMVICLGALLPFAYGAQAATVVFDANFNASTAITGSVTDNATVANLNAGTSVGSWVLSGAGGGNPGAIVANSNHNNNAFVFDSVIAGSVFNDLVRGNLTQSVSLTSNEALVFEFDLFASRAGNERHVRLALQDSAQNDAYIFVFHIDNVPPMQIGYVNSSGTVVLPSSYAISFVNPAVDSYLKSWTASPHVKIVIGTGATGSNTSTLSVDWNGDGVYTDVDDDADITFGHRTANLTNITSFELRYGGNSGNKGAYFDNFIALQSDPIKTVTLSASPTVADNDKTDNPVTLTYTGFSLVEPGSTYAISAIEGSAAFPSGGQAGIASNGTHQVAATVDGTAGAQTVFRIIVSEGAVPVATNTATVAHQEVAPEVTTVLFADTFDRADNNDLDAETAGMSGTLGLGSGVYLETLQVGNISSASTWNDMACSIFTNLCRLGYSNATANVQESGVGINHNFIDSAITAAGNFSMSAKITANSNNNEENDRWVALSAGCTLDEINAWTAIADPANRNVRGSLRYLTADLQGLTGTADFTAGINRSGFLSVVTAGYMVFRQNIAGANPTGNLRVDFGVTDFNKGSFASYIVYWNNVPKTSGFFRWQNANQNYLAFSGRANSATGARLDDLQIGTCAAVAFEGPSTAMPPTTPVSIDSVIAPVPTNGLINSITVDFAAASNVVYALRMRPLLIYGDWLPGKENNVLTGGEIVRGPSITNTTYTVTYNPLLNGSATNDTAAFCEILPVNWNVPLQ